MSRFRRFLHLEKDRPDAGAKDGEPRSGRFGAIEPEAGQADEIPDFLRPDPREHRFAAPPPVHSSQPAPSTTGAALERFSTSVEGAVRTDVKSPPVLLGSRCYRCEREFGRFDTECRTCGNPLSSPEQFEYTQRLAAERSLLLEQERAEVEALRARRSGEETSQRRAMLEAQRAIGRELAAREAFGEFQDPWSEPAHYPARKWVVRTFSPAQRAGVRLIALLASAAWLSAGLFGGGGGWRLVWLGLGGALLWAFLPRFWARRPPTNGPPDGGRL